MLRVERTGAILATSERWASSAFDRMRGLLKSAPLDQGHALVIPRARQLHTFGMAYAIDAIFCDHGWSVLHVIKMLRPNRITRWVRGAYYAIELPAGASGDVMVGDRIDYSLIER